jgi:hypothetical protein
MIDFGAICQLHLEKINGRFSGISAIENRDFYTDFVTIFYGFGFR